MSKHILTDQKKPERRHLNWADNQKMDCVILAGTHRNPKRLIKNQNKAFLELNGKPLIAYVVEACLKSKRLQRLVVVGPRNELEKALKSISDDHRDRLSIIQQRSRVLENVWNGFLATFPDGNNLPLNKRIDTLLLGGHIPIKKKAHLHIIQSVYAAVAGQMRKLDKYLLHRGAVMAVMERRFDEFRSRYEHQEWFMGKMGVETILADGHILQETPEGVRFRENYFYEFFSDWETRFTKYIFISACDLPLMIPECVDDFIDRCNRFAGDFFISVSSSEILKHFYKDRNGEMTSVRPYLSFREAYVRAANLMIVTPNRVGNKELIQEGFGIRKMTQWRNVFSAVSKVFRLSGRILTVRMVFLLQLAAILNRHGLKTLNDQLRRFIRVSEFEELLSRLFMTHLKLVETPYGGISLDVDDETDYQLLCDNYDYWLKVQESIVQQLKALPMQELHRIGCFRDVEGLDVTSDTDLQ
ncbi:NTP transferase domain-containing protein [bacterium]|nr:NTP transferase domain-containing protein [bacterium]